MKVGIIGVGAVGAACAKAMLLRGSCHEIVLLDTEVTKYKDDRTKKERVVRRDEGVATDLSHGELLCPPMRICHGTYEHMADAAVIVMTAGINEREGRAISRDDTRGRLLLLPRNGALYNKIMPELIAAIEPDVPILVVTDPPDPLADIARRHSPRNPIISAGTYLDTLRFRLQIGTRLECHPASVDAIVIGEHGTSQVYVWSSAQVGGKPVQDRAKEMGLDRDTFCAEVEEAVRYANINIIEGTGASQHGIGIVTARIVEAIIRDEGLVAPVGLVHEPRFDVTLSLPASIRRGGASKLPPPPLSDKEQELLDDSAAAIAQALADFDSPSDG